MIDDSFQLVAGDVAAAQDQADVLTGQLAAPAIAAATAAAPAPSTTWCAVSSSRRIPAAISSSLTSMISSTRRGSSAKVIANGSRVASPSANVVMLSVTTRRPSRHERYTAGDAFGLHAHNANRRIDCTSDRAGAEHPAAGTHRNKYHVEVGSGLQQFESGRANPGDKERLVRRVNVAQTQPRCMFLGRQP